MRVGVQASGLWTPGIRGVEAWRAQRVDPAHTEPDLEVMPRRSRRRATPMTGPVADVLTQLCAGRVPMSKVGVVLATVGGELETTFDCLRLGLEAPPSSSPARFRNSLHNSLLGHLSIAANNRGFASAVTASATDVVGMGLLEAMTYVVQDGRPCAVVWCDGCWPTAPCAPLAAGLLLGPDDGPGIGRLGMPKRGRATLPSRRLGDPEVRKNPSIAAADLVATMNEHAAGDLSLGTVGEGWIAPWWPDDAP